MHIVLVCREYVGSARSGGIGSYMQEIANAYVNLGHKVTIITASDNTKIQNEEIVKDGLKIIRLSGGDFFIPQFESGTKLKKLRVIYRFHSYRKKLYKVINSLENVDIVEVADFGAEGLYLNKLNGPVVVRLHTPSSLSRSNEEVVKPSIKRPLLIQPLLAEKKIFSNARYLTGCSQAIIDWVGKNFDITNAKTAIVYNPVDISHSAIINNKATQSKTNTYTIFYAGTISATKGITELVSACEILRSQGLDITLKLAGKGGAFQQSLGNMIKSNNWNWIEFLGKLPREKVYEYYQTADICCFPSWWENMPMVILESMALGGLVVSTDAGGSKEIITDGYNGFLCKKRDAKDLAEKLKMALTLDNKTRDLISQNAMATIREEFSIEKIAQQMLGYFNEVIKDFKCLHK